MNLLDLALQGLQDLAQATQVFFKPGQNALVIRQARPVSVLAGLMEVLYPRDPPARFPPASRGAITFKGLDGATYRLARDLKAGSSQLSRLESGSAKFEALAQTADEVGQHLQSAGGLPPTRRSFEAAYVIKASNLPSLKDQPLPPELEPPEDPERKAMKARLSEIERQLQQASETKEMEFELDGLQKRKFDIQDELAQATVKPEEIEDAKAGVKRLSYLDVLGDDFVERFGRYATLVTRRNHDLERWEHERDELKRTTRTTRVEPVRGDWRVWWGLLLGGAAIGVGLFLGGKWRYLAFLDIPFFGLTTAALWIHLTARQELAAARRRLALSDKRREKIVTRDKREVEAVDRLVDQTGLESAEEIEAAINERNQGRQRLVDLQERQHKVATDPQLARMREELQQINAKVEEREAHLATWATSITDIGGLETEADGLRAQLTHGSTQEFLGHWPDASAVKEWIEGALAAIPMPGPVALKALNQHASILLQYLTGKKLTALTAAVNGEVNLTAASQQTATLAGCPAPAQDAAFLALRGAVLGALGKRKGALVVVGDMGAGAGGATMANGFLKRMAESGQVLQLVADSAHAPGATHIETFGEA